jgi:hypothetical protein
MTKGAMTTSGRGVRNGDMSGYVVGLLRAGGESGSKGGGAEGEGGGGQGGGGEGGGTEVRATEASDHAGANHHNLVLPTVPLQPSHEPRVLFGGRAQDYDPGGHDSCDRVALAVDRAGGTDFGSVSGAVLKSEAVISPTFVTPSTSGAATLIATSVATNAASTAITPFSVTTCSATSAAVIAANSVSTSTSIEGPAAVAELRAHGARASGSVTVTVTGSVTVTVSRSTVSGSNVSSSAVLGSGMESKCLNLRGGGCGASKDSEVHSYDKNAAISAGLPSAAQQQHERQEVFLAKRARVGDTVAAQEMAGAPVAKRATGLAAPATADVSALTTKASQPVQEFTIIKLSGAADKLDGSSKKAMQTFLHLPSHQMASNININRCDAVRLTAHSAVWTRCSESTFETPIVSVVKALGPLVGKPEFEGDTNTLLEILRFLVLGVGAGTRAKGENLFNQCGALVAALKKPAGRAALVQVRGGSSPAEQGMHIAMAEAALRTLPRPSGDQYKAAGAALRLMVSIAKSAATMSLDANLLTSLQDCVQLAGNATSPTRQSALSL